MMDFTEAIQHLQQGSVILCPTDTIWGLSGDATEEEVANRIYDIKKRPKTKHFILLVADIKMLQQYIDDFPTNFSEFLDNQDRPTTIIYSKPKNLPKSILATDGSIAIRVSSQTWLSDFIQEFGRPIISTSANISGEPSPRYFKDISSSIKTQVDYIVPYFQDAKEANSSRIIRLNEKNEIVVIRE